MGTKKKPATRAPEGPRILAVANQKGGCGKTTVAMHLAGAWGRQGRRVLVVDADAQGTATRWAATAPDEEPFPAVVVGLAHAGRQLHREVARLAASYDLVVIDCPPAVDSPIPQSALMVAHACLVPVIPSPPDLWAAVGIRDLVKATTSDAPARLVLNMMQPGTTLSREVKSALADFGIPVARSTLGFRQAFRQAAVFGSTVHTMKGGRDAAKEADALAKEALALLEVTP